MAQPEAFATIIRSPVHTAARPEIGSSSGCAVIVKMVSYSSVFIALGLLELLVPGATPK